MASTGYYNHIIPVYLAVSRHGPPAVIWEKISILFFGSLGMQCMAVAVSWASRWQGLIWFSLSKCPGQDNQVIIYSQHELSQPGGWVRRLQTSDLRKTRWDFSHLPSLAKGSGAHIKITLSSWQCFWLSGTVQQKHIKCHGGTRVLTLHMLAHSPQIMWSNKHRHHTWCKFLVCWRWKSESTLWDILE